MILVVHGYYSGKYQFFGYYSGSFSWLSSGRSTSIHIFQKYFTCDFLMVANLLANKVYYYLKYNEHSKI